MKTTETHPTLLIQQEGDGYAIVAEHSAFVKAVFIQPIKGMKSCLVLFSLKDGSEYAYHSKEFTPSNLFASLFSQEVLSLGKWLNSYIKPFGTVLRLEDKDASLGLRVSDRFPVGKPALSDVS